MNVFGVDVAVVEIMIMIFLHLIFYLVVVDFVVACQSRSACYVYELIVFDEALKWRRRFLAACCCCINILGVFELEVLTLETVSRTKIFFSIFRIVRILKWRK